MRFWIPLLILASACPKAPADTEPLVTTIDLSPPKPEAKPDEEKSAEASNEPGGDDAEATETAAMPATNPDAPLSEEQVRVTIQEHIADLVSRYRGVFKIKDSSTNTVLQLELIEILAGVENSSEGQAMHATFHPAGLGPERTYEVDFWVQPAGSGSEVTATRIHKEPTRSGELWTQRERYVFKHGRAVANPK